MYGLPRAVLVRASVLAAVLTLAVLTAGTWADDFKPKLADVTRQSQQMSQERGAFIVVWWIPEEFWQVALSQNPRIGPAETELMLNKVRPYTTVVVVDGTIAPSGKTTFLSLEEVKKLVTLKDEDGVSYSPLADEAVRQDMKDFLQMMKPVLGNVAGPTGQNMHFILFPSDTAKGERIADARKKSSFSVLVDKTEFKRSVKTVAPLVEAAARRTAPQESLHRLQGDMQRLLELLSLVRRQVA